MPMDEALVEAVVDISGRAHLAFSAEFPRPMLGDMDTQLVEEFFRAFGGNAHITLHLTQKAGSNAHHIAEAAFKAAARAMNWTKLDYAVIFDVLARMSGIETGVGR